MMLYWNDPIKINETGELVNDVLIWYNYEIPYGEYGLDIVREIIFIIIGIALGVLLSNRIRRLFRRND